MNIKVGPLVPFIIGVSVVGAFAGLAFGHSAGVLYVYAYVDPGAKYEFAGTVWGCASGFAAGLLWCAAMIPIALRFGPTKIGRIGALCGLVVGSLATLALHTALARVAGVGGVGMGLECLFFAVPVGLAAGAACGCVCRMEVRQALRGTENARWTEVCAEERGEE